MDSTNTLMHSLLSESLKIWSVRGAVAIGEPPAAVIIHVEHEIEVRVEAAVEVEYPIRWWVRWKKAGMPRVHSRPCISTVGVLRTIRNAMGVDDGLALHITLAAEQS